MPTQVAIAQHLDLSSRSVRELQAQGVLPAGGSMDECRVSYIRHIRERAAGRIERPPAATEEEMAAEKLRLTKNQADETEHKAEKARLEVEVLRGSLRLTEEVESEWAEQITSAKSKLLSIPTKAASLVLAAKSRLDAEAILKTLIYEALEELARGDDDAEGDEKPVEPAAEPDRKPVGRSRTKAKPGGQRRARKVQQ